jgi:dienelactone hydrolase
VNWKIRTPILTLAAAAALRAQDAAAAAPTYWGGLEQGPYAVAFEVVSLKDPSRTYGREDSRPITLGLWRPLAQPSGARFPFDRYVRALELDENGLAVEREVRSPWYDRLQTEPAKAQAIAHEAFARIDASPSAGAFPLVIYAPGFGATPTIHTATAEYLASHGFVVAASASKGADNHGMTFDGAGLDAQARDLEFAIGALLARRDVDREAIGVVGYSFGGAAAVLTAMRRSDVDVVVSLDGAESMTHAQGFLHDASGFRPALFESGFVRVGRNTEERGAHRTIAALRHADRTIWEFDGASHGDFFPSDAFADASGEKKDHCSLARFRVAAGLLRAALKQALSDEFRAPIVPDLDPACGSITMLAMSADPEPSVASVNEGLADPSRSAATLDAVHRWSAPDAPLLTEGEFDRAAVAAIERSEHENAARICAVWRASYPRSASAYAMSGEALLAAGDRAGARRFFRKALSLRSRFTPALDGLERASVRNETGNP